MISLYRMFQIIFGIVVSVFVLYFLVNYASNYAGFQEDFQKVIIAKNLKATAESVYTFGNPVVFSDTRMHDFTSCSMRIDEPEPPKIYCDFGSIGNVLTPMILSADQEVIVSRADLNFGWHLMYWVLVIPESRIIFTPTDASDETWNIMRNITSLLPSTESLDSKVTFGFCDGDEIIEDMCGGTCDKFSFMDVLDSNQAPASKCSRTASSRHKMITISSACSSSFTNQGVCVKPISDGFGKVYIGGYNMEYVYKDPVDILALLFGGRERDVFDKTIGERIYDYKNHVWGERLALAAKIMKQRMLLVSSRYQAQERNPDCIPIYSNLANLLCSGSNSICNLAEGDYTKEHVMRNLVDKLKEAKSLHRDLIGLGCEYYV